MPRRSNVAVFRFAYREVGSGKRRTRCVRASTRTIAFNPLSVTQAAPSGPTITPCGDDPAPSRTRRMLPVRGSSRPSSPVCCPVYQTEPSRAGATSCGCEPAGTGYSCSVSRSGAAATPTPLQAASATSMSVATVNVAALERGTIRSPDSGRGRAAWVVRNLRLHGGELFDEHVLVRPVDGALDLRRLVALANSEAV